MLIDVTQFAFISSEELMEIMGEPDRTEDWTYGNVTPITNYEYDRGIYYMFLLVEDKVAKIHLYSERYNDLNADDIVYDSIENIPLMFGIADARKYEDNGHAVQYHFKGNYELRVPIMDQAEKTLEEAHVIFDTNIF